MNAGYPMRWILTAEAALFGALLAALLMALCARLRWRWLQIVCATFLAIPGLLVIAIVGVAVPRIMIKSQQNPSAWSEALWFLNARPMMAWVSLGLGACLVLGLVVLPWRGLWRRGETPSPIARNWSLRRLSAGCIGTIVFFTATVWGYSRYLAGPIAAARQAALESARSLIPPAVPEAENAYPLILKASDLMPKGRIDGLPTWFDEGERAPLDDVRAFVDQHQESLEVLAQAVRRAQCRVPFNDAAPIMDGEANMETESIEFMQSAWRVMKLANRRAEVLAADGELNAAILQLEDVSLAARHLRGDPRISLSLFADTMESMRMTSLEESLNAREYPANQFTLPVRHVDDRRTDLPNIVRWECARTGYVWFSDELFNSATADGHRFPLFRQLALVELRVFTHSDDLHCMPDWTRRIEAVAQSDAQAIARELELYGSRFTTVESTPVIIQNFPGMGAHVAARVHAAASRALADLGIAMAGYHARHASYPATVEELAPEFIDRIPMDPWSGAPLRMFVADKGIVLYSVGRDGIDNGGQLIARRPGDKLRELDQTFCLGRIYEDRKNLPRRGQ